MARQKIVSQFFAGVAQLARALAFQAKGRGFEPRLPLIERLARFCGLSLSRPRRSLGEGGS